MNLSFPSAAQHPDFPVCVQFFVLHLACVAAFWTGLSRVALLTCLALYVVRMFAITAGFHRLFAHRTYRTGRVFQFLLALAGTAAYQKGPLWWAAHHRQHHLYTDLAGDVHSPLSHSVWHAHVGWFLLRGSRVPDRKLVANLEKYRELRLLDRYYALPPALLAGALYLTGLLLQRLAPELGTSGVQLLVWGFGVSTVLLYHGTFAVNSLAHLYGRRRFATPDNSRNNFLVALITLGEGWHNNHHHYPASERQGLKWWEIDISHYILQALAALGIVRDLHQRPPLVATASAARPSPGS